MKYTCNNPNCERYQIEVEVQWNGSDALDLKNKTMCPVCRDKMKCLDKSSATNSSVQNITTSKLSTMSILERKEMLKKRSDDHYRRTIKNKKEFLDNQFIKQAKNS